MASIRLDGYQRLMRDLKQFEPELRKATLKEINSAAGLVRSTARKYVPADPGLSGWDRAAYSESNAWYARAFVGREVKAGIKVVRGQSKRDRTGYKNEVGVANTTAAGAIYETAGSKSDGKTPQGRAFIAGIASTGLPQPLRRLVIRAIVEKTPEVSRRVKSVLEAAERKFNSRNGI